MKKLFDQKTITRYKELSSGAKLDLIVALPILQTLPPMATKICYEYLSQYPQLLEGSSIVLLFLFFTLVDGALSSIFLTEIRNELDEIRFLQSSRQETEKIPSIEVSH